MRESIQHNGYADNRSPFLFLIRAGLDEQPESKKALARYAVVRLRLLAGLQKMKGPKARRLCDCAGVVVRVVDCGECEHSGGSRE
jgi:hypothetical protein